MPFWEVVLCSPWCSEQILAHGHLGLGTGTGNQVLFILEAKQYNWKGVMRTSHWAPWQGQTQHGPRLRLRDQGQPNIPAQPFPGRRECLYLGRGALYEETQVGPKSLWTRHKRNRGPTMTLAKNAPNWPCTWDKAKLWRGSYGAHSFHNLSSAMWIYEIFTVLSGKAKA